MNSIILISSVLILITVKSVDSVCELPKDTGHCRASFTKFYFDQDTSSCKEFIYGGCGGNENRFNDKESCEKICLKDSESSIKSRQFQPRSSSEEESKHYQPAIYTDINQVHEDLEYYSRVFIGLFVVLFILFALIILALLYLFRENTIIFSKIYYSNV